MGIHFLVMIESPPVVEVSLPISGAETRKTKLKNGNQYRKPIQELVSGLGYNALVHHTAA
jgi:hypothetical protein